MARKMRKNYAKNQEVWLNFKHPFCTFYDFFFKKLGENKFALQRAAFTNEIRKEKFSTFFDRKKKKSTMVIRKKRKASFALRHPPKKRSVKICFYIINMFLCFLQQKEEKQQSNIPKKGGYHTLVFGEPTKERTPCFPQNMANEVSILCHANPCCCSLILTQGGGKRQGSYSKAKGVCFLEPL